MQTFFELYIILYGIQILKKLKDFLLNPLCVHTDCVNNNDCHVVYVHATIQRNKSLN